MRRVARVHGLRIPQLQSRTVAQPRQSRATKTIQITSAFSASFRQKPWNRRPPVEAMQTPRAARPAAPNPFLCENSYCPFPDAHRDEITTGASE